MNKKTKQIAGIAMLFSAISLVVTFVVLSIRKRSFIQALLILATAEGTAAAILLADKEKVKARNPFRRKKKLVDGAELAEEDFEADELFDDEGADAAEAQVRDELSGNTDEDEPRVKREIPRDEEATEADFQ